MLSWVNKFRQPSLSTFLFSIPSSSFLTRYSCYTAASALLFHFTLKLGFLLSPNFSVPKLAFGAAPELLVGLVKATVSFSCRLLASISLGWLVSPSLPQRITPQYLTRCLQQTLKSTSPVVAPSATIAQQQHSSSSHHHHRHFLLSKDNSVTRIEWTSVENGAIGDIQRLSITYSNPTAATAAGAPTSLILKALGKTTKSVLFGHLLGVYRHEFSCFEKLPSLLPRNGVLPRLYDHYCSWHGQGWLLMEDYGHLLHEKSRSGGASFDQAASMLLEIAQLHGHTWRDVELAKSLTLFKPWVANSFLVGLRSARKASRFMSLEKSPMHWALFDKFEQCFTSSEAVNDPNSFVNAHWRAIFSNPTFLEGPQWFTGASHHRQQQDKKGKGSLGGIEPSRYFCLNHADVRLDNAFFDVLPTPLNVKGCASTTASSSSSSSASSQAPAKPWTFSLTKGYAVPYRCHLIDWQLVQPRHPIMDIIWLLGDVNPDIANDKEKVSELIGIYSQALFEILASTRAPHHKLHHPSCDQNHCISLLSHQSPTLQQDNSKEFEKEAGAEAQDEWKYINSPQTIKHYLESTIQSGLICTILFWCLGFSSLVDGLAEDSPVVVTVQQMVRKWEQLLITYHVKDLL